MIDFGDQPKNLDTIVTRGEHAGRMYYCKRPFHMGGGHYYMGANPADWVYVGGGPQLAPIILQQYLNDIAKERLEFLKNWMLQHENKNLILVDMEDGTMKFMIRNAPQAQNRSSARASNGASGLPEL